MRKLFFKQATLAVLLTFSIISCSKDKKTDVTPNPPIDKEPPIEIPDETRVLEAEMGNDYDDMVWVDLSSGKVVAKQNRYNWDIAFEGSGANGYIFVNGGKNTQAALSDLSWEETTQADNLEFDFDRSNGSTDSLAIGDWQKHGKIIVIKNSDKFKKIEMHGLSNGKYRFRFANLDGFDEVEAEVATDANYNTIMYSLDNAKILNNQPAKNKYDLLFGQYGTHLFDGEGYIPYSVNGVLLNPNGVTAGEVQSKTFDEVDESDINSTILSGNLDAIGYNWKSYVFTSSQYEVDADRTFIVRDRNGVYFKLHFIDFYNDKGEKGTASFEFKKLR
ncbi:MAG: HmuY family protein [Chitinophagales bacterium]|nr:HmuY family protein [Chitinophagales bacterium]